MMMRKLAATTSWAKHELSHRQDGTHQDLYYTSCGVLVGMKNSSIAISVDALPLSYVPLLIKRETTGIIVEHFTNRKIYNSPYKMNLNVVVCFVLNKWTYFVH